MKAKIVKVGRCFKDSEGRWVIDDGWVFDASGGAVFLDKDTFLGWTLEELAAMSEAGEA